MKKSLQSICLFFLLVGGVELHADLSYWDDQLVRSYVHNSDLQRRWAWSFLVPHLHSLKGNEQVLDIGCGDGKISADIARFIPKGTVLGVDLSPDMIAWAQKQYHPYEFPNLRFQEGGFISSQPAEFFDLIVSFCALQHCSHQQMALRALEARLKPGGRLLILVPAMHNEAWNQARANVQARERWADYWKDVPPRKFLNVHQYQELLEKANLAVINVQEVPTMDPFTDREEMIDWLCGTFTPVVSAAEAREFYDEWIEEYLWLDPQAVSADGVIYAKLGYISLEAKKK